MANIKSIFDKKFNELNEKRKEQKKKPLKYSDLSVFIFADIRGNDNTKAQRLSACLSGKNLFNSFNLRVIRKIFRCTIDELFPVSQDIEMVITL